MSNHTKLGPDSIVDGFRLRRMRRFSPFHLRSISKNGPSAMESVEAEFLHVEEASSRKLKPKIAGGEMCSWCGAGFYNCKLRFRPSGISSLF